MRAKTNVTATIGNISAEMNRADFAEAGVLVIALIGPPGAGKTALVEATARQLRGHLRLAVIIANPAAERDAERISRYCDRVHPLRTASPDAGNVRETLTRLNLNELDLLLIESMGGIAAAPDFGQDATVAVLAVSGGDDKAAEYGNLLAESSLLLLSMAEMQRHVVFDRGVFRADARRSNPSLTMMEVSAFENSGIARWVDWLIQQRNEKYPEHDDADIHATAQFFG